MSQSPGIVPNIGVNRSSQIIATIIPAGKPLTIFQAGSRFYLIVATGVLTVKPNNSSANEYVQGTGLIVEDSNFFNQIRIENKTANPIVLQIFVGFGDYIDNRLIVYDPSVLQVPYSTSGVPNTLNEILIPDLSATPILDANGTKYLALNRIAIYISNVDNGDAYDLQNLAGTKAVLAVQPLTNIVFPCSGSLKLKVPTGTINAVVSEIYNAILPT